MSLTDVALACGFSSSSDFSRSFRVEYGAPPSAFDVVALRATNRAQLAVAKAEPRAFDVTERDLPARRVAYVRVFAPYSGGVDTAAQRLIAWATERGLEGGQWLGYQWEDPELVPLDQCRYDVGLEVPRDVRIERDGEISVTEFPAMKVAEIEIAGPIEDEVSALEWLFAHWLPASGYVPDHQPCFEAWNGLPFAHGATHFELRVQLAVL
jgi:AraC family transcriptional regulator